MVLRKEWRFPPSSGGVITGFNDPAIDTFSGTPLSSAVRELIQNSLDAPKVDRDQPIKVKFKIHEFPKSEVPEVTFIRKQLEKCSIVAEELEDEKASSFYQSALDKIDNEKTVKFLAIHDFNTVGLTGKTDSLSGPWAALVKGTGITQKSSDSLGSYGHGSKAPFCLSSIRSIFYLSFIEHEGGIEKRFQGKSILQSHYIDQERQELSQAVGYFGFSHATGCNPCKNEDIPEWANKIRQDVDSQLGTTIIVPYFKLSDQELPETAISCIGNFFYAVDRGNLEIEIDGETILNKKTIRDEYYRYFDKLPTEQDFIDVQRLKDNFESLKAIVECDHHGTQQVTDLDTFTWYIKLLDKEGENRNRVAIARKDGMLIKHNPIYLERFRMTNPFEMYVCVDGTRGSELLKRLENPRHDDFEFERINDNKEREKLRKQYKRITKRIRDIITDYAGHVAEEEQSDSTMNKWFKPAMTADSHGEGVERGTLIRITKAQSLRSRKKDKQFKSGDGALVTQSGQGHRSGEGEKISGGGSIAGPGTGIVVGGGVPTTSKVTYRRVENLRYIKESKDSTKLKLIFDNPGEGDHELLIELAGEEGRRRVQLKASSDIQSDRIGIQLGSEERQMIVVEPIEDISSYAIEAKLIIETKEGEGE